LHFAEAKYLKDTNVHIGIPLRIKYSGLQGIRKNPEYDSPACNEFAGFCIAPQDKPAKESPETPGVNIPGRPLQFTSDLLRKQELYPTRALPAILNDIYNPPPPPDRKKVHIRAEGQRVKTGNKNDKTHRYFPCPWIKGCFSIPVKATEVE
jgi:hypothetical protein